MLAEIFSGSLLLVLKKRIKKVSQINTPSPPPET